jgi:hypothetical protein
MLGSDNEGVLSKLRIPAHVRPSRYDIVLWVIPLAFLLALVAATVLSTPTEIPLVAASVVGALALFDGLFRNPPIRRSAD